MKKSFTNIILTSRISLLCVCSAILCACSSTDKIPEKISNKNDVAVYVWPAFQPAPEWKKYNLFQKGIGEWEFVKEAESKKVGHNQPKKPVWGYEREDDPNVIARKIDACLASGINVFIYDWYWYDGSPFLENGLNAFLKAPNSQRMKFAIMWANHDIDDLWDKTVPIKCADKNGKVNIRARAKVSIDEFKNTLVPRWLELFKKPNYYKINGKPLFQVFDPNNLSKSLGGEKGVSEAFEYFEKQARDAGFAGVEFQCQSSSLRNDKRAKFLKDCGYDGIFVYHWLERNPFSGSYSHDYSNMKDLDYKIWGEEAMSNYEDLAKKYPQFYFCANVTCGWDTNPRFPKDVYVPVATNNTPERFEAFLHRAKLWTNNATNASKLIVINSLNEWTEGSYIEPDEENGYGFLNAIANVFYQR